MSARRPFGDPLVCWECGAPTITGLCEEAHPAYDHHQAKKHHYVHTTRYGAIKLTVRRPPPALVLPAPQRKPRRRARLSEEEIVDRLYELRDQRPRFHPVVWR